MSHLHLTGVATLRDFLRDAPRPHARTAQGRPAQVEAFIILDYTPSLGELGEVISRHRPVASARPGSR